MRGILRIAGTADVVSGVIGLTAAGWLADQLGAGTTVVRVGTVVLLVLGVETILLAARPAMAKATIVIEALAALGAIDLAVFGDATATGTALLVATAIYCAAIALRLFTDQRARVPLAA